MWNIFERYQQANLFLHFLNAALLLVEVGGRWTTASALLSDIKTSPTSVPTSEILNDYITSRPVYPENNGHVMLQKTDKLTDMFSQALSQLDEKFSKVPKTEAVDEMVKNQQGKDRSKSYKLIRGSSGGFLEKLLAAIHKYAHTVSVNIQVNVQEKDKNEPTTVLETQENESTENNDISTPVTDIQTQGLLAALTNRSAVNDFLSKADDRLRESNIKRSSVATTQRFPFEVAVVVTKPRGAQRNSVMLVPLMVDMTVLDAFISATRQYLQNENSRQDIPYNILIDWNDDLQCFVTIKAVGIENRRKQAWYFTVRNNRNEIVYKGRCLPGDAVILRPRSIVQITYEHIRRRSS